MVSDNFTKESIDNFDEWLDSIELVDGDFKPIKKYQPEEINDDGED